MPETTTDQMPGHGSIVPRRIVLHTTEGIMNAEDLAPFFRRSGQADVHAAIDRRGDCVHIVPQDRKAWHVAAYNPSSLGIEQCAYASYRTARWMRDNHLLLLRTAAAISNWATAYGIPIKRSKQHGVCGHVDLGGAGGGHWDPGPGYPWRYVLYLARIHYHRKHKGRGWRAKVTTYKAYCSAYAGRYSVRPRTKL